MRLTKHHGLGNDFLVVVGGIAPDPELARSVCDRHRGIGADGLLHLDLLDRGEADDARARDGGDVAMVLLNADGSRAEMSGNGVACLAQAAVLEGLVAGPFVGVATDAGRRDVELQEAAGPRTHLATVDMGVATVDDDPGWAGGDILRASRVDVGNPHLVVELASAERAHDRDWLAALGAKANAAIAGGINVEAVVTSAPGALLMDVYERGVGLTDACGTGAVATAAAARAWGLTGATTTVTMHGGAVVAETDGDRWRLTTTVVQVGTVEFPWP